MTASTSTHNDEMWDNGVNMTESSDQLVRDAGFTLLNLAENHPTDPSHGRGSGKPEENTGQI